MAVRSFCLAISTATNVLLLVLALCALGVRGQETTPKISVGFTKHTFSGEEGEEAGVVIVKVQVPEDFKFDDSDEGLTILVTSVDGEAKDGRDFEKVNVTNTLKKKDLERIRQAGRDDNPGHENVYVEISFTEDEYIESSQTFTLTLEVHSDLDVEKRITSATFTIEDKEMNDTPGRISFNQPSYTAYTSQNTSLTVSVQKTGRFRQNISVDVTFSNGPQTKTICFKPSQNVTEVSFDPGNKNATYSLSLALAKPSQKFEKLVECGAPVEVRVMTFSPEGFQILNAVEEQLQDEINEGVKDVLLEFQQDYQKLSRQYADLQRDLDKLVKEHQQDHEQLQKTLGLAVWFTQNDYAVWESDETLTVCLTKNMETSEALTVVLASANGDIIAPQKIIIPAGNEDPCENVSISITDDSLALEKNETFTLTLKVDGQTPPVTSSATVTIMDDDVVEVSLTDEVLKPTNNNDVQVCVEKKGDFEGSLGVPLELSPADPNSEAVKATVTFKSDDTAPFCVKIPMKVSDYPYDLKIGTLPMGCVEAVNSKPATVYAAFVSFTETSYTAKEGASSVSVHVKAFGKVDNDFEVHIISKEGSPKELADLKVTIPKDGKEGHAEVSIKDIAESFTVVLDNPPAHVHIVSPGKATVIPQSTPASPPDGNNNKNEGDATDPMVFVWVVVVVIILIVVVVAAYIIYHQRKKIKSCLALEEQGGKGRKGRYRKLPANIREALHQD